MLAGLPGYLVRRLALAAIAMLLAEHAAAQDAGFAGGYNGSGNAGGMSMLLQQEGAHLYGRIVDGQDNVFQLSGEVSGGGAEGTLYNQTLSADFRIERRDAGVRFILVPIYGDGRANLAAVKNYSFSRGAVSNPLLVSGGAPVPKPEGDIDLAVFVAGYASWSMGDVAKAYALLDERERTLVNAFDYLQADVMNRMCRGAATSQTITIIAQNQGLTCLGLTHLLDEADASGLTRQFHARAEAQRVELATVVACERNVLPPTRCVDARNAVSNAALDWRDARQLFAELAASPVALGPALIAEDTAAPVPRERPIIVASRVGDGALASADQSEPALSPDEMAALTDLGFQLRGSLGTPLPAKPLRGTGADGAAVPPLRRGPDSSTGMGG